MKKKILLIAAIVAMAVGLLIPNAVYASGDATSSGEFCQNVKNKSNPAYSSICGSAKGETDAENVVKDVLTVVFTWTGIIAVIVIIIGGVFYMTSQGDPGKVSRAKNAILYALIGLIVSLLSFAIVNFVLTNIG